MANKSIYDAFDRMKQHITAALQNKSDTTHTHDLSKDWTQNNSTANDYIKNRTHYEEMVSFEETVNFSEEDNYTTNLYGKYFAEFPFPFTVEAEKTYTVIFDGITYECVAQVSGAILLGNPEIALYPVSGNNEPFLIAIYPDNSFECFVRTAGTYTFKVESDETIVHTLDEKFIPSLSKDWNQNDQSAKDYIQNRTHYEELLSSDVVLDTEIQLLETDKYTDNLYGIVIPTALNVEVGKTYTITLNGTTYECVVQEFYDNPLLGNPSIPMYPAEAGTGNNEPFFICIYPNNTFEFCVRTTGTYDIKIESIESIIHTLDEKFIPQSIKEVAEWFAETVEDTAIILKSSTSGSSKRFKITVDDSGTLSATEIV